MYMYTYIFYIYTMYILYVYIGKQLFASEKAPFGKGAYATSAVPHASASISSIASTSTPGATPLLLQPPLPVSKQLASIASTSTPRGAPLVLQPTLSVSPTADAAVRVGTRGPAGRRRAAGELVACTLYIYILYTHAHTHTHTLYICAAAAD